MLEHILCVASLFLGRTNMCTKFCLENVLKKKEKKQTEKKTNKTPASSTLGPSLACCPLPPPAAQFPHPGPAYPRSAPPFSPFSLRPTAGSRPSSYDAWGPLDSAAFPFLQPGSNRTRLGRARSRDARDFLAKRVSQSPTKPLATPRSFCLLSAVP